MAIQASNLGTTTQMGATPAPGGTYLRCWAPSATSVFLIANASAPPQAGKRAAAAG